ncbi:MAG: beta-ketoacyl-[acyl-carrier-protein] synthase family protein [Propionibacteriaceae bacterium]|jgi:3-oxoacyl-[acyl-carrier-protein] synthase II|nr:beta-ketoacyl-[acyl-carrier-protein] synthase family protein [Propionibacteriaceae bacterium]
MTDIVVTGVGLLTSVGANAEETWANVQAGKCGISEVDVVHTETLMTRVGAQVRDPQLRDSGKADDTPEDEAADPDRCHELAYLGAKEALEDAGLGDPAARPYASERIGLIIGTLLGGVRRAEVWQRQLINRGGDLLAANEKILWAEPPLSVANHVARRLGIRGPRTVPSNACAASAVAIAYGLELLDEGSVDCVVAGGADPLSYLAYGGFSALESLDPEPCAPYSRSSGLSLGEGSGFLILERREDALRRGAKPIAVVAGYGLSADAHHATAPDPTGEGAIQAVRAALAMAGLRPEDVGYVNGHGTGTPANDLVEPKAIRAVFGTPTPPLSSTKSILGHTLGAAGAVEAAVTVLGLRDQLLPPTVVPEGATPLEGFDIVPNRARPASYRAAVSTSFAFGGNNAALVLATPDVTVPKTPPLRDVVITGFGAITGDVTTADELHAALAQGQPIYGDHKMTIGDQTFTVAEVPPKNLLRGINPQYIRKMDALARRLELAVAQLLKARGLSFEETVATGLVFATGSGPVTAVEAFQGGLIKTGSGNAKYFPNTVMNAAPGHTALLHQLKGPTATLGASATGATSGLWLAQRLIARGAADRIVVASADEANEILAVAYAVHRGYYSPTDCRPFRNSGRVQASGGFAIMLEAAETAPPDRVLGRIEGHGFAADLAGDGRLGHSGKAWADSFRLALEQAGHGVDAVVSAATGRAQIDDLEARALRLAGLDSLPVFAPKSVAGDAISSYPLAGLMAGLWACQEERLRPEAYGYYDGFGALPDRIGSFLMSTYELGATYHAVVVSGR